MRYWQTRVTNYILSNWRRNCQYLRTSKYILKIQLLQAMMASDWCGYSFYVPLCYTSHLFWYSSIYTWLSNYGFSVFHWYQVLYRPVQQISEISTKPLDMTTFYSNTVNKTSHSTFNIFFNKEGGCDYTYKI